MGMLVMFFPLFSYCYHLLFLTTLLQRRLSCSGLTTAFPSFSGPENEKENIFKQAARVLSK